MPGKNSIKSWHDLPLTSEEGEIVVNTVASGVNNVDSLSESAERAGLNGSRVSRQVRNSEIGSEGFDNAKTVFRDKCGQSDNLGEARQCLAKDMGDVAATAITNVAAHKIDRELEKEQRVEW